MKQLISDHATLIDVRTAAEFAEGHVKDSFNIPVDQIENHLEKFNSNENIIVFCQSGMRSAHAKSILEQNGFKNITNGGSWKNIENLVQQSLYENDNC